MERRSREVMRDDDPSRVRVGLSNRTWQDIWRGAKTIEMEPYSYAAIDQTFGWTPGTAFALHHGETPPQVDADELAELRQEVEDLRAEVRGLFRMVSSALGRIGREE